MSTGHILIIAPEYDLRQSLEFALAAEGYAVTSRPGVRGEASSVRFDCTVLDEKAIAGRMDDLLGFIASAHPVVLLADAPVTWLSDKVVGFVEKPMLGAALSAAVALAVRLSALPASH